MGDELSRRDAAKLMGLSLAPAGGAGRSASGPDGVPDLLGRAVLVWNRGRPLDTPVVLTDCRFELQGGRVFLVGTTRPCRSGLTEWADGARRCIAWDAVDEYAVFDSLAEYHGRLGSPSAGTFSGAEANG